MHIYLNLRMEKSTLHEKAENEKNKTKNFHHAFPLLDPVLSVLTCHGFRIQKNQNP